LLPLLSSGTPSGIPLPIDAPLSSSVEPGRSPGTVSAGVGGSLRAVLEHYQVQEVNLAPGETVEGFLYLKSKKTGGKLSGGSLRIQNQVSIEIP